MEFVVVETCTLMGNSREVHDLGSQLLCLQHNFMHGRKDLEVKRDSVSKRVYEILLILIPQEAKQSFISNWECKGK